MYDSFILLTDKTKQFQRIKVTTDKHFSLTEDDQQQFF